ncbi:unnamed protein product [Ectocarpus fasciculatus]
MKPRWKLGTMFTAAACFGSTPEYASSSSYEYGYSTSLTMSDCYSSHVGDGWCDSSNNNADCEYDGGDCCSCDCIDDTYTCGVSGFTCIDPSSSCTYHSGDDFIEDDDYPSDDDDDHLLEDDDGIMSDDGCFLAGDGFCDSATNNAECNWDGGDCCECDCSSDDSRYCGYNGYSCINPGSSCYEGTPKWLQLAPSLVEQSAERPYWLLPPCWRACAPRVA